MVPHHGSGHQNCRSKQTSLSYPRISSREAPPRPAKRKSSIFQVHLHKSKYPQIHKLGIATTTRPALNPQPSIPTLEVEKLTILTADTTTSPSLKDGIPTSSQNHLIHLHLHLHLYFHLASLVSNYDRDYASLSIKHAVRNPRLHLYRDRYQAQVPQRKAHATPAR